MKGRNSLFSAKAAYDDVYRDVWRSAKARLTLRRSFHPPTTASARYSVQTSHAGYQSMYVKGR